MGVQRALHMSCWSLGLRPLLSTFSYRVQKSTSWRGYSQQSLLATRDHLQPPVPVCHQLEGSTRHASPPTPNTIMHHSSCSDLQWSQPSCTAPQWGEAVLTGCRNSSEPWQIELQAATSHASSCSCLYKGTACFPGQLWNPKPGNAIFKVILALFPCPPVTFHSGFSCNFTLTRYRGKTIRLNPRNPTPDSRFADTCTSGNTLAAFHPKAGCVSVLVQSW